MPMLPRKIMSRHEAYLYNLKNSINDTLEGKLDESNK